jgi:peptidoglycan/LPS O-acetylase OafA/YrhL
MDNSSNLELSNNNKSNNFNLLRLLAALQVVYDHTSLHLNIKLPKFFNIIYYFPGVPIFFGISGFLITSSYFNNNNLRIYFRNRFLRIYPALWVCFLITIILLFFFRKISISNILTATFIKYFLSQVTFLQFYTPLELKTWGVGSPNGSLWTIVIELQFYLILPFLANLFKNKNKIKSILFLSSLAVFTYYLGRYYLTLSNSNFVTKILHISFPLYLNYFLLGIISYIYWDKIKFFFKDRFIIWLLFYLIYIFIFSHLLKLYKISYYPNIFGLFGMILLWFTIISFAFSFNTLSNKVLSKFDISYGIYLYHMLVINIMYSYNYILINQYLRLLIVISCVIPLGLFSWIYVEKPLLKRK